MSKKNDGNRPSEREEKGGLTGSGAPRGDRFNKGTVVNPKPTSDAKPKPTSMVERSKKTDD